jgi:hypothetical protein
MSFSRTDFAIVREQNHPVAEIMHASNQIVIEDSVSRDLIHWVKWISYYNPSKCPTGERQPNATG